MTIGYEATISAAVARSMPRVSTATCAQTPGSPARPRDSRCPTVGSRRSRRARTIAPRTSAATPNRIAPSAIGGSCASATFVTAKEVLQISAAATTAATAGARRRRRAATAGPGGSAWWTRFLRGRHAEVDLRRIGRGTQAMVAVQLRPPNRAVIESFQAFVAGLPEVLSYFVMSGPDDFLLHVAVADNDRLSAFVLDRLAERREIVHVRTSVIFSHVRRPVVVPCRVRRRSRGLYPALFRVRCIRIRRTHQPWRVS